ncbi:MAG: phosphoenolpyruvate--protein phosphotransferase [Desulfobacterales bacterium]
MKDNAHKHEIRLRGIGASPGICIGKAYLVDREGVEVVEQYHIGIRDVKSEVKRFKMAVRDAKAELQGIIRDIPEDLREHSSILETHLVLFKDKMLYGRSITLIEKDRVNAEWALKKVVERIKSMFRSMPDAYLKERAADIVHVAERILLKLTGSHHENISDINKRVILVARDLSPADTSQIYLARVMGFLTDLGGKNSHTGIIARTLGIPAVLGLENATATIRNDEIIIVDGGAGLVILHPEEKTLIEYEERRDRYDAYRAELTRESRFEARTLDGVDVQVLGNIELPEEVVSVIDNGGDGIGLYRTEFQYLSRSEFPTEFELFDKYKDVVEVMAPRPVTIRTLDINGDKALSFQNHNHEPNPVLGLRAIRYCLKKPAVFVTQLRAILRAAAFGNVRILFPMISNVTEVVQAIRYLDEAADSLKKEGTPHNRDIEVGVMIEVPSAAIMADHLADLVDFFSIGTNDLIQYTLAIDRGNRNVAYLYDPLNPAIVRMIKHVAEVGRRKGVKVAMCGEMAGEPIHVPILLGLGITEWSMNPYAIPIVKRMARALSAEAAREFIRRIDGLDTAEAINTLAWESFGSSLSQESIAWRSK